MGDLKKRLTKMKKKILPNKNEIKNDEQLIGFTFKK